MSSDVAIDAGLGPGPSRLGSDAAAKALRDAGYELTDFAGALTPGARFEVRVGRSGTPIVRGPVAVARLGSLAITSGRVSAFDPLDRAALDHSVDELDRAVPVGEHPVLVSRDDDEALVVLVRFSRTVPAVWTPASARASARFSLALSDHVLLDEILARVMVAPSLARIDAMRALFGMAPLAPGDPLANRKSPTGSHPVLDSLRDALEPGRPVVSNGIVAFPVARAVGTFWGLDEGGEVAALACDLGLLRSVVHQILDVSLMDLHLSFRMTVGGLTLHEHPSHVLVVAPPSITVLDATCRLDGVESQVPMRTGRHGDGTCEHRLAVPEQGRMRATLRLRLAAMDRAAIRL